ncbi:nudix hydrolase 2, partial [Quercus suber]
IKVRGAGCLSVRAVMSASGKASSQAVERVVVGNEEGRRGVEILRSVNDGYEGVIVELVEPMDAAVYGSSLRASISHWRQQLKDQASWLCNLCCSVIVHYGVMWSGYYKMGMFCVSKKRSTKLCLFYIILNKRLQGKRGVWIKLPIELVNLVEATVQQGFWYHHAEPKYLMLVYWIPEVEHTLPSNATHRVGIGAFVMNEKREMLVVQENSGVFRGTGVWKFPTGVIEEGEDIFDAAVREVKEETGVDSKFVEVLAFRQSHQAFFQKSDLFFLCMLQPLSFDIQKQDSEIAAAQWMPITEYAAQPFVQNHELTKYLIEICLAKIDGVYPGLSPVPTATPMPRTSSSSDKKKAYLYLSRSGLNRD